MGLSELGMVQMGRAACIGFEWRSGGGVEGSGGGSVELAVYATVGRTRER